MFKISIMNEVINLIDREIIKLSESLRKYKILQQSFKDEGSENDTVNLIIEDYTERISVYKKSVEILKQALSKSQSVSDNEKSKEICSNCEYYKYSNLAYPCNCCTKDDSMFEQID